MDYYKNSKRDTPVPEAFFDQEHTNTESTHTDMAKAAFFGYAALAHLPPETLEHGADVIDKANAEQVERLRASFATVARTIMEIEGFGSDEINSTVRPYMPIEEEVGNVVAETLKQAIPKVGRRYLASMAGSVDDLALRAEHIPAIIEVLLSIRGQVHVDRRTLDIETLLRLRLGGMLASDIAANQNTSASRVKGAFFRFGETINNRATPEEVGRALREKFSELAILEEAHTLTKEELDAKLPPRVSKESPSSGNRTKRAPRKRNAPAPKPISLRSTEHYVPVAMPDDLLPGESMAERRLRLREEALGNS